jgi:hypothetical protein
LNTNLFPATCHSSNPALPPLPPTYIPGTCVPGDTAAVQFTYQTFNAGQTSVICVWNVDVTQQWYFIPQTWLGCLNVASPARWIDSTLNVSGSVDFTNHRLTAIVALPWTTEWDSVVAPDWYGLCWTPGPAGPNCAWKQTSGTILGAGGGSLATFTPVTSVQTVVEAKAACQSTGCNPVDLPRISVANPYKGATSTGYGTVETNNLSTYYLGPLPSTACSGIACTLTYTASTTPPQ